ncbi:TPA: hypothetical protein I8370_003601 [Klebsiella oxytoca]|nr:hypothetical protein [Klebsiella oxytoca]
MKLISTLLVLIIVLTGLFIWQIRERAGIYFYERCFANVTYVDASNKDFLFKGNVTFEFNENRSGEFNLTGDLEYQGEHYHLSRYVTFNYDNVDGNHYNMITSTKDIMAHDNIPDKLLPLISKILGLSGKYTLYINKNNGNYFTIANSLSPLMNCVIQ